MESLSLRVFHRRLPYHIDSHVVTTIDSECYFQGLIGFERDGFEQREVDLLPVRAFGEGAGGEGNAGSQIGFPP